MERGKSERRRGPRLVNRNYEAARLRICRAGSKRSCERAGETTRPVRDVDVLDHRREYTALRFCRREEHVYIYNTLCASYRGKIKFLGTFTFLDHPRTVMI